MIALDARSLDNDIREAKYVMPTLDSLMDHIVEVMNQGEKEKHF